LVLLGISDQALIGFASGILASIILTALGRAINKLVKLKPKQIGWAALLVAAFAIYFTPYSQVSIILFFAGFLWIFILIRGWRLFSFVKKKRKKEEKEKIVKKENRRNKGRLKKTIYI